MIWELLLIEIEAEFSNHLSKLKTPEKDSRKIDFDFIQDV